MASIHTLHPEKETAVTLTGAEWLAMMLALAGRTVDHEARATAEAKMLRQLEGGK